MKVDGVFNFNTKFETTVQKYREEKQSILVNISPDGFDCFHSQLVWQPCETESFTLLF